MVLIKFSLTLNSVTGCQAVVVIMTSRLEQTTVQWWASDGQLKANSEIKSSYW